MSEKWFRVQEFGITWEEFHRLPRHPAYKKEYFGGRALFTPRPNARHAVLELERPEDRTRLGPPDEIDIRPLGESDGEGLRSLFAAAFHRTQPFESLDDKTRVQAAEACLEKTRAGGDGPLVTAASRVATRRRDDSLAGALLITLLADGGDGNTAPSRWREPPPSDAVERRFGRPHLTWVFVSPWETERGVATALLEAAAGALLDLGYDRLYSTFLVGNDASLLWHWQNGFRLLPRPSSRRRLARELERGEAPA